MRELLTDSLLNQEETENKEQQAQSSDVLQNSLTQWN